MQRFFFLVALSAVLAVAVVPAHAAEPQPGDACSSAGETMHAGGPEEIDGQMMVCDGSNWKAVLEWDDATGRSLFQVGDDAGACNSTKTGRLRYTGSTPAYEYCSGTCWKKFPVADCGCASNQGLVGHWKLNESGNTSTAVDSAGSSDGTLIYFPGDPSANWVSGKLSNALDFDGSDDYVIADHSSALNITSSYTLSVWAKFNSFGAGFRTILNKNYQYYLETNVDEIGFGFFDGAWIGIETTSENLATGVWYHLVGVFDDSADSLKIYLDGVEILSGGTASAPASNTQNVFIGAAADSEQLVDGLIDDARIYNRALSATEISDMYNGGAGCE